MNYELAKKLKDAGFPTGESGKGILKNGKLHDYRTPYPTQLAMVYLPTLSELIEAVEQEWFTLEHRNISGERDWLAHAVLANAPRTENGKGSTPEEAVANLWLKLQ